MVSTISLAGLNHPASLRTVRLRWFAVFAAIWLALALMFTASTPGLTQPKYFFLIQDVPVAALLIGFLMLVQFPEASIRHSLLSQPATLATGGLLMAALAWAGHYWVMQGYALSRDEDLARLAATYIARGDMGLAIPTEWRAFHDAILPEFQNPMGGDRYWISIYLPGSALFEAMVSLVADPALTQPLLLLVGLAALWHVSGILMPDRRDARLVVLLLALTSGQLLFNAMTPYAMTAHFALNLIWLALFLTDRPLAHLGAVMVGAIAVGLHKVQFHILFVGPILALLLWQRRWLLSAGYAASYALFLLFWLKLYPVLLSHALDLSVPATATQGVGVSPRLHSLDPLIYLTRFFAWNNSLLLPLAGLGVWGAVKGFRGDKEDRPRNLLLLALAIGCATSMLLTVHQGHGWGYRYMHGYIGSFCLLAGWGWTKLPASPRSLRPVFLSCGLALLLMAWQAMMIHSFAKPYVKAHADVMARKADVVLVNPHGSAFGQDIVRIAGATIDKPVILSLARLDADAVRQLCQRHRVSLFDRADFARAGVMEAGLEPSATTARMIGIDQYLKQSDCLSRRTGPSTEE